MHDMSEHCPGGTCPWRISIHAAAGVHLEELCNSERRGDDYDRAHQESFLFHLIGTVDAYLQELNLFHECYLPLTSVTVRKLEKALEKKATHSMALEKLAKLEKDKGSWLGRAKEMRNHSMHRHSVSRTYYVGGEKSGEVRLANPRSGKLDEKDYLEMFHQWVVEMGDLLDELRASN